MRADRYLISVKARAGMCATMDAEENVRLAVFADIHANRQAFSACLNAARARGAERIICLGDVVGYGADPEWAVDTVMDFVADGAIAVMGNHDNAVGTPSESMNAVAQAAIEWTRGRLSVPQRRFLAELPLTRQEDDRLYVHAEASHPARWHYVSDTADAARSIAATDAHVTFCGHIHRPALYSMSSAAKMTSFIPATDVPVQLLGGRRWLAVLGSVGQPRDGDPAAAFAMFDTTSREITYCRVPYDVETAADRIRANGLPHWLADRLLVGR
jgi:diadenosine tetraphosphatase ApaH/serine/threonine PP2A family protein phosphatase